MKPILLILTLLFFSCKGTSQKVKTEEKKNNTIQNIEQSSKKDIDFFDKKYKTLYTMILHASTPSDHPVKTYINCNKIGFFTIHYVIKKDLLQLSLQKTI